MEKQCGVCRRQHHGDHHDEPHAGKSKKAGHARPAFHTERHGNSHLHHESHVLRCGVGQEPGGSGENNNDNEERDPHG
jgi:hypothetical protein